MIRRTPAGKYCDPYDALWHWLPNLLAQSGQRVFENLFKRAAQYCVEESAKCYDQAARNMRSRDDLPLAIPPNGGYQYNAEYHHTQAMRWLKKRDLLLKCMQDIGEVDCRG